MWNLTIVITKSELFRHEGKARKALYGKEIVLFLSILRDYPSNKNIKQVVSGVINCNSTSSEILGGSSRRSTVYLRWPAG